MNGIDIRPIIGYGRERFIESEFINKLAFFGGNATKETIDYFYHDREYKEHFDDFGPDDSILSVYGTWKLTDFNMNHLYKVRKKIIEHEELKKEIEVELLKNKKLYHDVTSEIMKFY